MLSLLIDYMVFVFWGLIECKCFCQTPVRKSMCANCAVAGMRHVKDCLAMLVPICAILESQRGRFKAALLTFYTGSWRKMTLSPSAVIRRRLPPSEVHLGHLLSAPRVYHHQLHLLSVSGLKPRLTAPVSCAEKSLRAVKGWPATHALTWISSEWSTCWGSPLPSKPFRNLSIAACWEAFTPLNWSAPPTPLPRHRLRRRGRSLQLQAHRRAPFPQQPCPPALGNVLLLTGPRKRRKVSVWQWTLFIRGQSWSLLRWSFPVKPMDPALTAAPAHRSLQLLRLLWNHSILVNPNVIHLNELETNWQSVGNSSFLFLICVCVCVHARLWVLLL